ncbi:Syntaxin-binding protein 5-like [Takifugu flavidus]|uniref:Syntaxin-binding protein 5-like n=2 Tax=Tetraodontidae TaxID=31031 RepID=A0A5C6PMA0_9TELE|nr:Syntaxin-binding protein 5-like [Takifugu flavidus]
MSAWRFIITAGRGGNSTAVGKKRGGGGWRADVMQPLAAMEQTVRHGFPYQPTALAFDPVQKILAIGSRSGGIRMYPFTLTRSLAPSCLWSRSREQKNC